MDFREAESMLHGEEGSREQKLKSGLCPAIPALRHSLVMVSWGSFQNMFTY